MDTDAFKLGEQIKLHTMSFKIVPELWDNFDFEDSFMRALTWDEYKFLNDSGDDFSEDVKNLPNDSGGIYSFIIKNPVLSGVSEYLAYIGRARFTDNHNLRVRCRRYLTEYLNEKERPKITTLMNYYKKHLYIRYTCIDGNELIEDLEAELINSILPPCNDAIPEKKIKQAVNAF
jgi:hypothetical protein